MGGGYGIYYEGERFRQVNGRMFKVPFRIIDNAETPLAPYHLTVPFQLSIVFLFALCSVLSTLHLLSGSYVLVVRRGWQKSP